MVVVELMMLGQTPTVTFGDAQEGIFHSGSDGDAQRGDMSPIFANAERMSQRNNIKKTYINPEVRDSRFL